MYDRLINAQINGKRLSFVSALWWSSPCVDPPSSRFDVIVVDGCIHRAYIVLPRERRSCSVIFRRCNFSSFSRQFGRTSRGKYPRGSRSSHKINNPYRHFRFSFRSAWRVPCLSLWFLSRLSHLVTSARFYLSVCFFEIALASPVPAIWNARCTTVRQLKCAVSLSHRRNNAKIDDTIILCIREYRKSQGERQKRQTLVSVISLPLRCDPMIIKERSETKFFKHTANASVAYIIIIIIIVVGVIFVIIIIIMYALQDGNSDLSSVMQLTNTRKWTWSFACRFLLRNAHSTRQTVTEPT